MHMHKRNTGWRVAPATDAHGIVGRSAAVAEILRLIDMVAATRSTVLITGETGTGKELVARAVHTRSAQCDMPFVRVNCAAIPDTLLESELFGHSKGAFTSAISDKRGKFALAHRGSILLDEVGTMSGGLQGKLLRVLQEREIEPLGAERSVPVDVRVIAATNRDLGQLVAEGRFQSDLFYRLHVVPIAIPPLRERPDDVPLLVEHFVQKHASRCGKSITGVDAGVMDLLQSHEWPGNVRELEHTIERAIVFTAGHTIRRETIVLSTAVAPHEAGLPSLKLRQNVEWVERETIRRALTLSPLKRQAAKLMGITPRALSHYLSKYRQADAALASGQGLERYPSYNPPEWTFTSST
jgi:transcriptional regulator with GAF, ATPase, and Fis domain